MFSHIAQINMQAMMGNALIRDGQDAFYERKAIALLFSKHKCTGTDLAVHLCGKRTPSRLLAHHISNGYATFSFALQSGYGEKQITTWLNCQLWGKRAETLAPMLTKGARIGITGELTNRPYVSKSDEERHSLELRVSDVTLLGIKENAPKRQESQEKGDIGEMEDDFPF